MNSAGCCDPVEELEHWGRDLVNPERRLLVAILCRAIKDARGETGRSEESYQRLRSAAIGWLMSNDFEPFSMWWVCEYLGFCDGVVGHFRKYALGGGEYCERVMPDIVDIWADTKRIVFDIERRRHFGGRAEINS